MVIINKIYHHKLKKNKKENSFLLKKINLEELFQSIIEYKYLPLLFAFIYLIILSYSSFTFHKIGDYGVETDFYQSYVPAAQEFLNKIKEEKDDYIYFGTWAASMRPEVSDLLNPDYFFPGLTPIKSFTDPPAVLYKVE